jgi:hypothetical protein
LLPHLRPEERQALFAPLLALAAVGHADISLVRQAILTLPRDWLLAGIEAAVEPLLDAEPDEAYRRFLELYWLLDADLTRRLAQRAAAHPNLEAQEAGRDFLARLARPNPSAPTPAAAAEPGLAARILVGGGRQPEQLILAVGRDGFVVWSADSLSGGPPYQAGWRPPDAVAAAVAGAQRLAGDTPRAHHYGPDARWTGMEVYQDGRLVVDWRSWHELFEARADLVATAGGVEPLAGRARADVLAAQPADYRDFRHRWEQLKGQLLALIPAAGEAYEPGASRPLPGL